MKTISGKFNFLTLKFHSASTVSIFGKACGTIFIAKTAFFSASPNVSSYIGIFTKTPVPQHLHEIKLHKLCYFIRETNYYKIRNHSSFELFYFSEAFCACLDKVPS